MIEIKVDKAGDDKFVVDELETTTKIDMYVDQILMALNSELGSIMGADVTLDLENLVFEQGLDEASIRSQVLNVISNFCSLYDEFETAINVKFTSGEIQDRDICLIEISINRGEKSVAVLIK